MTDIGRLPDLTYERDGETYPSYGAYLRSKSLRLGHVGPASSSRGKAWDNELNYFDKAVANGIIPDGTSTKATKRAFAISERTGVPYRAGENTHTPEGVLIP